MSKSRKSTIVFPMFLLLAGLIITTGCRRDMQDQPKMKPMRSTSFFVDGLSSRQPIEGTVPRGFLRSETAYFTGKKSAMPSASPTPGTAQPGSSQANSFPDDVDTFPFPITKEIVLRGQERYNIFCSV